MAPSKILSEWKGAGPAVGGVRVGEVRTVDAS